MVLLMFAILTMIVISMEAGIKAVAIIDVIVMVIGQNIVAMKLQMHGDDKNILYALHTLQYSAFDNTYLQVTTQLYDSFHSTL
jgi:hypothetical protein